MPGMRVILFTEKDCDLCKEAIEGVQDLIEKNEVEVMDIYEGLKEFNLGEPDGIPFMAVISPSTGRIINKIFFQDAEIIDDKTP